MSIKMNGTVSIAVLYNDTPEPGGKEDLNKKDEPLDFEPCFDVEGETREEEIGEIVEALQKEGFQATGFNLQDRFKNLLGLLTRQRPTVVFNLVDPDVESPLLEMMVAGTCEMLGIPYTGSTPFALGICQRKGLTKQVLLSNGIPTPRFKLAESKKKLGRHGLHYPLIVKPGREDGSFGVENESIVSNPKELEGRIDFLLQGNYRPVIVEEFIAGRELHVAILGFQEPTVLPISEIEFSQLPDRFNQILTYQAKWDPRHEAYHRTIPICPARLTRRLEKRVKEIALQTYKIMGCRDYARIDFRVDRKNNPFVLEVNPNPHLSSGMGLMRSAEAGGLTFSQTLRKIVEFALSRSKPSSGERGDGS